MALTAPTPPTPPTIDKGDAQTYTPRIDAHQFFEVPQMPFHKDKNSHDAEEKLSNVENNSVNEKISDEKPVQEKPVRREVTTPEDMAREAVANGAGALTKNTVTRPKDKVSDKPTETPSTIQNVAPVAPITENISTDNYERGQAVLREFEEVDKSAAESSAVMSTPAPSSFRNNSVHEESHGGIFWIVTLIIVVAAAMVVAKKFLFTDKPALKKSDLFVNSSEQLKSTAEKFSAAKSSKTSSVKAPPPVEKTPPVKPVTLPKKDDDGKGKRFEVRV